MGPLWYPKAELFKIPGPIHMLHLKAFFKKSYNIVCTNQCAKPRYLIESVPTISLKLCCGVPHPLEPSLIYLFKQSSQKGLSVWIKYFIKKIRIHFANLAPEPDSY